jgi:hypothetical protein
MDDERRAGALAGAIIGFAAVAGWFLAVALLFWWFI